MDYKKFSQYKRRVKNTLRQEFIDEDKWEILSIASVYIRYRLTDDFKDKLYIS